MIARTVPTPEHVIAKLSHTKAPAERADVSFWEYMRLDEYHSPRPKAAGFREKTACNYERAMFQIYGEMGHQLAVDRPTLARLRAAYYVEPAPVPQMPWEMEPPVWGEHLRWRNTGVKASLETQQKAEIALAWYWGQGYDLPPFLREPWATDEAVNRAKQAGLMRDIRLFLELPTDIQRLLAARPFETRLRAGKMWGGMRKKKEARLAAARYKDKLGRAWIFQDFYHGARISEMGTLRLGMYDRERGRILGWPQPKKGMAPRDVVLKGEDWIFRSKVDPSLEWYIDHVRPLAANEASGDHVFLNAEGEPYTEDGARAFIGEYIELALGEENAGGPHMLRRACATWRYLHGWELDEIAILLDDTRDVVEDSYIDRNAVRAFGRKNERSKSRTPPVPLVRSNGETNARKKEPPQTGGCSPPTRGEGKRPGRVATNISSRRQVARAPQKGSAPNQEATADAPEDTGASPSSFVPLPQPRRPRAPRTRPRRPSPMDKRQRPRTAGLTDASHAHAEVSDQARGSAQKGRPRRDKFDPSRFDRVYSLGLGVIASARLYGCGKSTWSRYLKRLGKQRFHPITREKVLSAWRQGRTDAECAAKAGLSLWGWRRARARFHIPPRRPSGGVLELDPERFHAAYDLALNDREGARLYGCHLWTFVRYRRVLGLGPKLISPPHTWRALPTSELERRMRIAARGQSITIREAAQLVGISPRAYRGFLKAYDIPNRHRAHHQKSRPVARSVAA